MRRWKMIIEITYPIVILFKAFTLIMTYIPVKIYEELEG